MAPSREVPRIPRPRYFFHLYNKRLLDHDGHCQADDDGALAYAKRVASELRGDFRGLVRVLCDEKGRQIGKVKITEAGPS